MGRSSSSASPSLEDEGVRLDRERPGGLCFFPAVSPIQNLRFNPGAKRSGSRPQTDGIYRKFFFLRTFHSVATVFPSEEGGFIFQEMANSMEGGVPVCIPEIGRASCRERVWIVAVVVMILD